MKKICLLCLFSTAAFAQTTLIPRDVLLGNPERLLPQISPDGKRLAYLGPDERNVMQVWAKTTAHDDARVVTADRKRGIRNYVWAEDSSTILYSQDSDGDENFHLYSVDLLSQNVRDLTPFQGVRAELLQTDPRIVDQVLLTLNLRDRRVFDVYRVSLRNGALELDTQNPGAVLSWAVDSNFVVRGAEASTAEGGTEILVRDGPKTAWRTLIKVGVEENVGLIGFTQDGKSIFATTSIDSDTERVVEKNLKTGTERLLAQNPRSDVLKVLFHPYKYALQAVAFDVAGRAEWTSLDYAVKGDLEALKKLYPGDFQIYSRDRLDATWVVGYAQDRGPIRYYLYERAGRKATFLFSHQPRLENLPLAEMKPVTVKARDGLELPAYVTVPPGGEGQRLPAVLLVHGGPWSRDSWGYNGVVQLLANRGYVVLQVNFRGSTGYGKRFLNAGNRQWGLKMHDDLLDTANWAAAQGIADKSKICVMGASYGGYSALAGAAFSPDTFRCAVDLVGPSNLATLLATVPPYWAPMKSMFAKRIGDLENPSDVEFLKKASPLFSADKIRIPLLIGQGANDPRVKQAESEQIVAALEKNGLPVTYVLYPDEGHGFARPENRTDFYARAEAFLAKNLGGRFEPMPPEGRLPGATAQVKVVAPKQPKK